ncbi:PREDICTED: uncharacterized protein LOC104587477 [Nelumbo nucifera]|uniref:Uncharacterized protein LOC104587477 n=2 Tax=Nelumbo nucifera TaxID=4432 RepID=A0A1U7Z8M0_NELNU|nr:PREDICTED: uncharacterized protein LOC104587477 [Nelumbo nucifera]DAD30076.1 TPA_asm: hypothetical protein HUJ06_031544 [Nelumbo nucifera]
MGSFSGQFVPGLALTLLGLWHTLNTIKAYSLRGPTGFSSRFWYPFNSSIFSIKHLELIFIFSFSLFAIALQVLDYPLLHLSFKLSNFEHATVSLHLAIYSGVALAVEFTHSLENLTGLVGVLVASVFGQELFLLHLHSAEHVGLEGHYHWLLQLIVSVSLVAAMAATSNPRSFVAALVLSLSVVLQGCWFMNMGVVLWVPRFVAEGCSVMRLARLGGDDELHAVITCGTEDAVLRAKALANLQLSWIVAAILILAACLCLKLAGKGIQRNGSTDSEQLLSGGVLVGRISIVIDTSKQVHTSLVNLVS